MIPCQTGMQSFQAGLHTTLSLLHARNLPLMLVILEWHKGIKFKFMALGQLNLYSLTFTVTGQP